MLELFVRENKIKKILTRNAYVEFSITSKEIIAKTN